MKLSRKFLVLASAALVAGLPSAQADVTVNNSTVLTGTAITLTNFGAPGQLPQPTAIQGTPSNLNIGALTTLTVNQLVDATTTTEFLSAPNSVLIDGGNFATLPVLVKTGGATWQFDANTSLHSEIPGVKPYFLNATYLFPTTPPALPNDLRLKGAFSGLVIVNQGTLQVSGYLNQWANYGIANTTATPTGYTPRMEGAGAVILQGSASLSFQGTGYNVVGVGPTLTDGKKEGPFNPKSFRLNYVHNLYSGSQANFLAGLDGTDVNTVLDVGKDADYIVNIHIDDGVVGSVGRIDGAGRVYKTGSGSFTILNTSRITGDVFVGGGDLVLSDPNNLALRLANSVNLIGSDGDQTALAQADARAITSGAEWRPGYLPGRSAPQLSITTNQAVRNFQSLWREIATNMWVAGTGAGTVVDIASGTSLTILQDANRDGYFTGSINGGLGRLIKEGAGSLALMGQSSSVGEIAINGGKIISNVQSLGYGRVVIGAGGTLSIVQNNAGTLRAQINGAAGSTLTVTPQDLIVSTVSAGANAGSIPPNVGNGQLGVIDIYNQQQDFYGQVIVKDGITLAFSFGKDDTFIRASNIVLNSGTSGRETAIRFNDTTQTVNNLSGDANTRIELGRGSITINQTADTAYAGKVTGAGNLIKAGNSRMTLSGLSSYYGATVVKAGSLASTATDGIINSSGLVLLSGTIFTASANQTVGALFGQTGSVVSVQAGATLTVGKTSAQVTQLNNALASFTGVSPDANPAYFLQTDLGAAAVSGMSQANTIGFLRTALGEPTSFTPVSGSGSTLIVKNTFGLTVGQAVTGTGIGSATTISAILAAPSAQAAQTATGTVIPLANTTGFLVGMPVSGTGIPAGTTISSIGTGSITLSASTSVAATGMISGTAAVTLSNALSVAAAGAYALSPVTTNAQVLGFRGVISGNGGLTKVGDQTLFLLEPSTYTGATNVNGGTLQIDHNTLTNTSGINVGVDGNLSVNVTSGTATFARPLSGLGSLSKVGAGKLIIEENTGWVSGAINVRAGILEFKPGTLAAITGGILNVDRGSFFLIDTPTDLTWIGNLMGAGTMTKIGAGTLTVIGGINMADPVVGAGLLDVQVGKVYGSNLPSVFGPPAAFGVVQLAAGTTYRDTVASATGSQTTVSSVINVSSPVGFRVGQTVSGTGIPLGAKITFVTQSSITLDAVTTVIATGTVKVEESFGAWILQPGTQTVAGSTFGVTSTAGLQVGMHAFDNNVVGYAGLLGTIESINAAASTVTLSAPTTAVLNSTLAFQVGDVRGAGKFEKAGNGTLTLEVPLSLTGSVEVLGGTLVVSTESAFHNVSSITLGAGATLDVSGFDQDLANVTSDAASTLVGTGSTLTLKASAGATTTYSGLITGLITGAPDIVFNEIRPSGSTAALGALNLLRPSASANVINSIDVQSGSLIGTIAGFGGATLNVAAGAKIGFNNNDLAVAEIFTGPVTGTGTIFKTGVGQVTLSNGGATASAYEVLGGKLTVLDTRPNGAASAPIDLINATIASGSTLEVRLDGFRERNLGAQIQGLTLTSQGTLQITNTTSNNSNVYLTSAAALAAVTLGDKVTLLQNSQNSIAGVNGSAGAVLNFNTGGAVTINQAINTSFVGTVSGVASQLTLVGPGRAGFTNSALAAQLGASITLAVGSGATAGHLEIDSRFNSATALTLNAGSLAVNVATGSPATFNTAISGAAGAVKFIKTGAGTLNANLGVVADPIFSAYEIEAGELLVTPVANQILGGRSVSLMGGNLSIQQDASAPTLGTSGFTTTSAGMLNVLGATTGPTGILTVTGSFAGGLSLQSSANVVLGASGTNAIAITGAVTVGAGSTLGGQAIIGTTGTNANFVNDGTVAPGYSPGIVTVNGNVTNTGAFIMELSATLANGTYNDQVLFTGTANLNIGGTGSITLKQYDVNPLSPATPAFGQRFVLFKDTLLPDASSFTSLIPASQITSQGISPFRYLLSIPGTQTVVGANGAPGASTLTVPSVSGLVVGQAVSGTNIPANSSIKAISTVTNTITLNTVLAKPVAGNLSVSLGSAGVPVVNGEIAAYVVRAPAAYDAFKAPASLLASIKSITQVDSALVNNGADTVFGTADDVYSSTPAFTYNIVGGGLAVLGDTALQTALDNLTPYGAAGTVTAAGTLFQQNINNAARRLELRRFDRSSLTILSNEWYVDTIGGKATVGASGELQNKATTYGITAGYTTQVGVDGVAGYALTAQHFSLSSDTSTSASGNGFAANAYVGTVAMRGQLSLDAGVSVSHLSSEITRDSVIDSGKTNVSSPSALTYGVWGRLGTVIALKSADTFITPFIGVQYASTKLSSMAESGQADAMTVTSGSVSQSSVRVGTGLHHVWEEGRGDWRYRLSMDIGYVKQLSGEFGDFTSKNETGINTTYTSSLRVSAGSGLYVNPSLNFGPDENSTFSVGLSYEQGNGNSIGVNAGYRKRF
ncbi:MAG: autotransporter-associated beta strand repeat-containing protein [Opitutales bacterium]|nr:autotransporter-associated beta strand repeat-containing protein [Opitutales bacterium]